jgi:hypothetical protein
MRTTTRLLLVLVLASSLLASSSDAFSTMPSFFRCEQQLKLKKHNPPSRRSLLSGFATAALAVVALSVPVQPALADYGSSASMELPSYIDFLIEKSKTNDPESSLYKGADLQTQLGRLKKATTRLAEIPAIAEQKKWTQITGILTGPLGELLSTMTTLVKNSGGGAGGAGDTDNQKAKEAAAKKVKLDLYAIGTGASKKNEAACKQATQAALKDLEDFIKLAF